VIELSFHRSVKQPISSRTSGLAPPTPEFSHQRQKHELSKATSVCPLLNYALTRFTGNTTSSAGQIHNVLGVHCVPAVLILIIVASLFMPPLQQPRMEEDLELDFQRSRRRTTSTLTADDYTWTAPPSTDNTPRNMSRPPMPGRQASVTSSRNSMNPIMDKFADLRDGQFM